MVYLCDLGFPGGTSTSLEAEVEAASGAGYTAALVQLRAADLLGESPINPRLRQLLDRSAATLVLPGERVRARLAIVKHPTVLARSLGGRLPIDVPSVLVTAGQVPTDRDGTTHYEVAEVDRNVAEALGHRPTWAPISPAVRSHLLASAGADELLLTDEDWVEVIDPAAWRCERSGTVGSVPVIGRHSRPSRLKWPASADELLAAYPDDPAIRVRVLGGITGVEEVLGRVPVHWEVLEFGAMSARDFLAGIDVFVYFHHPDMVEAFGRSTLEALATGAVAVVPRHFEPLFGDACIYATPAEVRGIVEHLHRDDAAYTEQSRRGLRAVAERFSYTTHVSRLQALIGAPAPARRSPVLATGVAEVPPGLVRQTPTVLVAALGASSRQVAAAVRQLAARRAHEVGFDAVVVTTVRPPASVQHLGIAIEPIMGRKRWDGPPEAWPQYARRRLRGIARKYGVTSISVLDLSHPDAWIPLGVRPPDPANAEPPSDQQ